MDWRMVGVILSLFQFIFMAVIFSVLKFNDLKHLDADVHELKKEFHDSVNKLTNDFHESELKNSERHAQNIEAMGKISNTVSHLTGKIE